MSDKFGDERDPYLYPALNVLRNRLGIRQAKNLQQAAFEMTALRAATLPLGPRVRGLPYLCAIHHQLYQDLFDWAGRLREVNLYLGDTPFCHFARIEEEGNALMQALEQEDYLNGLPRDTFARSRSLPLWQNFDKTRFAFNNLLNISCRVRSTIERRFTNTRYTVSCHG